MNEPDRLEEARRALQSSARIGARTPLCLDPHTLAALVDGTLEASRREAALSHLAGCDSCQSAVASVARVLNDPDVARAGRALNAPQPRRLLWIALPLAAAAALVLVLSWPRSVGDGAPRHRGSAGTPSAPVPIAPIGIVSKASPLLWTAVAGADRYRVTLSDAAGRLIFETEGADTVVALPDSVALTPGRSYVWMVEARSGFDRWSTSQLVEFSIAGSIP